MSSKPPTHLSESLLDRKASQQLQLARQSGTAAPAVDAASGKMINPHNPEFLTKKPWYLTAVDESGAANNVHQGPTLEHQAKTMGGSAGPEEVTLSQAEQALEEHRQRQKELLVQQQQGEETFIVGQWVEGLKKKKPPYQMCQIVKVHNNNNKGKCCSYSIQFEDGTREDKVLYHPNAPKPRLRPIKTGNRAMMMMIDNTNTTTTTAGGLVVSTNTKSSGGKETYDSKRDAYFGYDVTTHNVKLADKYQARDELRRHVRETQQQQQQGGNNKNLQDNDDDDDHHDNDSFDDSDIESDDDEDEFVQKDQDAKVMTSRLARQGGVGGAQMKVTARNLRIREDTAKYLRNLDPNSAYYDPKSRSMRDNPTPHAAQAEFVGDNFSRSTGQAVDVAETQLFAWQAAAHGERSGGSGSAMELLHPQANPSQVEFLKKEYQTKASELKQKKKQAVLDRYGGAEYLQGEGGLATAVMNETADNTTSVPPDAAKLRFGVQTIAEEYSQDGRLLKSAGKEVKQGKQHSKYDEDVFTNGHTTVWGSYFHKGAFAWGYADDHSMMKSSYCTGENGRIANDEANEMRYGTGQAGSAVLAQARGMLKAMSKDSNSNRQGKNSTATPMNRSKLYGEADLKADIDKDKLQQAIQKAEREEDAKQQQQQKKRKYHSMEADVNMTEEDMEAYRLMKERKSDPMANIGTDELLDYKKSTNL